jgi:phage major head subunit gpT-like protein
VDIVTPTAPTAAEMETAILSAIQSMYGILDDKGRKTNASAKAFSVMVPLPFMKALATALKADVLLEGGQARSSNMSAVGSLMGLTIEGIVNPRLTWTDKFSVFRKDGAIKPFVFQVERDPHVAALAEGSEEEVKYKRHLYTVDASYNTGLNQWRGAQLVQLT